MSINKIWEEWFSGTLSNWTTSSSNVAISTFDNDEKLQITSVSNSSEYAERSISEPSTNEFIIETDLYYSADAGFTGYCELLDSANNIIISASFGAGTLTVETDNDLPSTIAFPDSDYRQLIITIDKVNDNIRFYLSDANGGWGSWDQVGSAKSYSGMAIAKIKFRTQTTGHMRVDEVVVYSPDIFVIGDSRMDGKPLWSAKPNWQARTSSTENELAAPAYQLEQLNNVYVANRSFGGSNSTGINNNIQKLVIDQFAKRVVVCIGHNDLYGTGSNVDTLKTNINSIITKLQNAGITGDKITFGNIAPSLLFDGTPANDETNRIEFNRWLTDRCAQIGAKVALSSEALNDNTKTTQYKRINPIYDVGDGIHYNLAGSAVFAETIFDARVPGGVLRPARANNDIRLYPADYLDYTVVTSLPASSSSSSVSSSGSSFSSSSSSVGSMSSGSSSSAGSIINTQYTFTGNGYFYKQPSEIFTNRLDLTSKLNGTAISWVIVTAVNTETGTDSYLLIIDSISNDTGNVYFKIKSGTAGESHKITFTITLTDGSIKEIDIYMHIKEV